MYDQLLVCMLFKTSITMETNGRKQNCTTFSEITDVYIAQYHIQFNIQYQCSTLVGGRGRRQNAIHLRITDA